VVVSRSAFKDAGFGKPQRPAEGLIPLEQVLNNARRDARERPGAQGRIDPHTGLPLVDTSQPGPGAALARNLSRAYFTQTDFGRSGAFGDRPSGEAQLRLLGFLEVLDAATAGSGGGGRGPSVGPGSPVRQGFQRTGARVTTGMDATNQGILRGLGLVPGIGTVAGLVRRFGANTPGVIGDIAPQVGTPNFAQHVAMGRLAGALGRPTAGTGVRSGRALGAQGIRGL
jgi:hypothetical protein